MNHPLDPKKKLNIHADLDEAMQREKLGLPMSQIVEPGRREQALDPGPETTSVEVRDLANPNCPQCNGRGVISVGAAVKGARLHSVPCSCAERGYQKLMEKRIVLPCRFCSQTGWCQHRPRTLAQLVAEQIRSSISARAAFMPQGGINGPKGITSGRGQDSGIPPGQEFGQGGHHPGRQDLLPGLQPGDPDA